jgi:hypothetical protein
MIGPLAAAWAAPPNVITPAAAETWINRAAPRPRRSIAGMCAAARQPLIRMVAFVPANRKNYVKLWHVSSRKIAMED